ncbi:primosomal replication protein PriC [Avibacterium sp. 20-129]|uniref:primosomal replication protein PriC n=1 Tax=Avibacterium sp. 20-129 TaxID=2911525 RepID=UPI0022456A49|nr:primosomal replication protein PriC [Avibacterium sp. 20-129]MCW9699530.1 primosomal replication protein [Avibacterium sp. 20-129]
MNKTQLIQALRQKIAQCYQQYPVSDTQKIYAKFDRTLFSEDFQHFKFYRAELNNTLAQIERLQENEHTQCQFYTEKLLAQLQALLDALKQHKRRDKKTFTNPSPQSAQNKQQHAIHRLPPRERLAKYYEALQALNQKIAHQQDQYVQTQNELKKQQLQQLIRHTEQRRTRCLEAIELLEEHLDNTQ